ncbi:glycosyltransferase family 4 protein [Glaciibacter sp. 2TAF33]|uniref:glycosyltransferase family 4 protein n=1 Tax=Glaciibacter sp. 2TAF33 TaxID=3233015 RepID=UPI003F8E2D7F
MRRNVAVHVGRHGEVAGGMTQVVNGYLGWDFDDFDTRAISSRDGSTGIRAAWLAASAAGRILLLRGRENTVVVVHLSERGSFVREGALLLVARARGFATVGHLHGSEFRAFAHAHPRLVGRVLRAATVLISLSEESNSVAERFVPAGDVVMVPNAVAAGAPRLKERLVVFGGAVKRRKGVDVLVSAWRSLTERMPGHGWRLVVAGPIVEPDLAPPPDAIPDAEFTGALDHAALMALLDRSSVAVLPSRDEAMPMFILEAMARTNAVVSTAVGGIPAVLGDGAGVLVEPGDVDALTDALQLVISDEVFRGGLASRASASYQATYSTAAVFPRVEAVWKLALERRAAQRRRSGWSRHPGGTPRSRSQPG